MNHERVMKMLNDLVRISLKREEEYKNAGNNEAAAKARTAANDWTELIQLVGQEELFKGFVLHVAKRMDRVNYYEFKGMLASFALKKKFDPTDLIKAMERVSPWAQS